MKTIDLIAVLFALFALLLLARNLVCLIEMRRELRRLVRQRERLCQDRERIAVAYETAQHDLRLLLALTIKQQTADALPPVVELDKATGRPRFRINPN